jgi:general secretion pathway protein K
MARQRPGAGRGVALVAVLWIVAALSILVMGMVRAQRDEIRLVSSGKHVLQGGATAKAAIQLVLQQIAARSEPVTRLSQLDISYGGLQIPVEVIPLNGFIDINRAGEPLLRALFAVAGGMDADRAEALAKTVVASRVPGPGPRGPRFEAVEDLLQVPGVDFSVYARLSPLTTTDTVGSGRVNAMAAPEGVLLVLSEGNTGLAARIAADRDGGGVGVDTTGLTAQYIDTAAATRFRLVARVPLADGRRLLSTWLVETGRVMPDGVPWRILHAENRFEPTPATMN